MLIFVGSFIREIPLSGWLKLPGLDSNPDACLQCQCNLIDICFRCLKEFKLFSVKSSKNCRLKTPPYFAGQTPLSPFFVGKQHHVHHFLWVQMFDTNFLCLIFCGNTGNTGKKRGFIHCCNGSPHVFPLGARPTQCHRPWRRPPRVRQRRRTPRRRRRAAPSPAWRHKALRLEMYPEGSHPWFLGISDGFLGE